MFKAPTDKTKLISIVAIGKSNIRETVEC